MTTSKLDVEAIVAAILDVKKNNMKPLMAAKKNCVPKSSLYRYIEKVDKRFPNINIVTDDEIGEFVGGNTAWKTKAVIYLLYFY